MNPGLLELALKRERLIGRIDVQRERLAGQGEGLQRLCVVGDYALAVAGKVRDNPQWVMLATLAFVLLRPRRAWRLAKTGFILWRAWVAIRRRWSGFLAR